MRSLRPHEQALVDRVLQAEGARVVLQAPPGSGTGAVVTALCRQLTAGDADRHVLIVVHTRSLVEQYVSRLEAAIGAGAAVTITGRDFRYFLDEPNLAARILVVTASLVTRDDVHTALSEVPWSVIVSETAFDPGLKVSRAVLDLPARQAWLFIDRGALCASGESLPEHERLDWYELSRDQLGLYPERRLEFWAFDRPEGELEALTRFEALLADVKGSPQSDFVRRTLLSTATSSPVAFESVLLQALRGGKEEGWQPRPEAVEDLVAQLETLTKDHKLATFVGAARRRVEAGEHVVVFCRRVDTAAYLHEALAEEWPDVLIATVDASVPYRDRHGVLDRWRSRGGVLIATMAVADVDLSVADVAVAYDPVADSSFLERLWGSIDLPGRQSPATLALLEPTSRSRLAAEQLLSRDGPAAPNQT